MRFSYIIKEVTTGLRRNLTLSLAVVITVAVSLSLFGSALLINAQVNTMKDYWFDRVEVSIFLCGNISDSPNCADGAISEEEKGQIRSDLQGMTDIVDTVFYESKEQALARFKEQFKNSPIADTATADQMPESFRVKLIDPTQFAVIEGAFGLRPGVEQVIDQRQTLQKLFDALGGLQKLAQAIAGVMILVTVLLISNTMRVAAYNRRRETGIMRLVGASNFTIQLPFLLEAAVAAGVGSLVAIGALVAGKIYLIDQTLAKSFTFTTFIGWDAIYSIVPVMLGAGVGLAVFAAGMTLRKYLKV